MSDMRHPGLIVETVWEYCVATSNNRLQLATPVHAAAWLRSAGDEVTGGSGRADVAEGEVERSSQPPVVVLLQ